MAAVLNANLLRFAAQLEEGINDALNDWPEFGQVFAPIGVHLYTVDGLTAQFLEEGIEFYPEAKEVSHYEVPVTKNYVTLGDIAEELTRMKEHGMSRDAIIYALDRVYWEEA